MADEKPYWVELETGCLACGRGREYRVIGPDDVALGATFDEEADAEEYAENLTAAYEAGRASAADPLASAAKTFALMPRYRTGGYGAMVEDDRGKWVNAKDVEDMLENARPEYQVPDDDNDAETREIG